MERKRYSFEANEEIKSKHGAISFFYSKTRRKNKCTLDFIEVINQKD